MEAHERGIEPAPQLASAHAAGQRFPIKYYLTAMLFIVFDIEIVFLYPWAVAFDSRGAFALVEMLLSRSWYRSLRTCVEEAWLGTRRTAARRNLLSTVEKVAGYVRKGSLWPATSVWPPRHRDTATAGPRSTSPGSAWSGSPRRPARPT
jgi:hypothetical protein